MIWILTALCGIGEVGIWQQHTQINRKKDGIYNTLKGGRTFKLSIHTCWQKNTQQKLARPPEENTWNDPWPLATFNPGHCQVEEDAHGETKVNVPSGERPLVAAGGLSGVELGQGALGNPLQHLLGEDSQELPANVQGFVHRPVVVGACGETLGGQHHRPSCKHTCCSFYHVFW